MTTWLELRGAEVWTGEACSAGEEGSDSGCVVVWLVRSSAGGGLEGAACLVVAVGAG